MATEKVLKKLLLYSWEGPTVKFLEEKEQERVIKGEQMFDVFLKLHRDWVDPNTQVLALRGDAEGKRMAGNQIHYKTLKGKVSEEYEDTLGARSYVEALIGKEPVKVQDKPGEGSEGSREGWKLVTYKKKKEKSRNAHLATIFVAKIPQNASAKEVWSFFKTGGEVWTSYFQEKGINVII